MKPVIEAELSEIQRNVIKVERKAQLECSKIRRSVVNRVEISERVDHFVK